MKVLLSSIAKNDIKLLMRVFNAKKENNGIHFLEELKETINEISLQSEKTQEINISTMKKFPVNIHYIFENEEILFVTAIFKI
ncbi:mannosyltransferase OCH1-like enzyme [Chryseobacterium ginsenosidimutans]|uniref:hypothetical protein n=1 Tax=Chryseobacterium ginsenosidimutans TaxID=687846 RepID=UPI00278329AB|nr:hypothetical protein [Chryseobacterium ginsenosidimutans]MDQ0592894.1 mannosyltransferase OCH1-like enzyme [Chryseobacterium ginsenosidimutans]